MNVNLASRPLRNGRAFIGLAAVLAAVGLVLLALAAVTYLRYHGKHAVADASWTKLRASITTAEKENREFERLLKLIPAKDKDEVKMINEVIYRKNFSWTDFLSRLEESLPPSSYLSSLSPSLKDNAKLEVKLKVVCRSQDDLFTLITNLNARKFGGIRVLNESRKTPDTLISELTLTYERHD